MARHVLLPKGALSDVQALLRLEEAQLRTLEHLFGTGESIAPDRPEFLKQVTEELRVEASTAQSVVLVCQFLLTVVEESAPPAEVIDDLREFLARHTKPADPVGVVALDAKRGALEALITPKADRSRARKVRSLSEGPEPTARSFRTVCELRPVFGGPEGEEAIVGYASALLLEIRTSGQDGEKKTVVLRLPPEGLRSLSEAVKRAEAKLEVVRQKFGPELLNR